MNQNLPPQNVFNVVRPEVWIFVGVLMVTFILRKFSGKQKNLPPGPIGLPLVGYFPFLTQYPHLKFLKLAEKYGNVFSFYIGSRLVVILNGADCIREVLSKRELLGRPPILPMELFLGIRAPEATSIEWLEHRKFMLHVMRDLRLGKSKMENLLQDEIQHFLNVLEQSKGQPMDVRQPLIPSVSNNICSLIFGQRFEYDNPVRIFINHAFVTMRLILEPMSATRYFQWILKYLTKLKLTRYTKSVEAGEGMLNLIQEKMNQHKETLDPKNTRDYIDAYLLEMEKKKEKNLETTFSDVSLKGSILFLFNAGSETIKVTLANCMYAMAAFPKVQKKVKSEIREVLGPNKFPEFLDQKNMPYTKAVNYEILRWSAVVSLNPARYTLDDVYFDGYCIPKGSEVIANFWSVHHNPKYWENPEEFRPERFINSDGSLTKSNYFMPFSIGKRSCPGEQLAFIELFLYFVAVLQRFQISFPEGYKPSLDADVGATLRLKKFPICFIPN